MADPISIIGAVGAMANIIQVVTKTIQSISHLHDRCKEANLTLLSLASQLTALRAALTRIRDWMENDLDGDPHHQLVMDLDVSVKSCELLVGKIDMLIGKLADDVGKPLAFKNIVKLVFKENSIEDVQKLIERQTSALALLLTACNCKILSEQKSLLENSNTRKVFTRAQIDSASLYVNRDSASFVSRFTDNLSKLSVVFNFDSELFSSRIYQQALRGSVKEALRRQQDTKEARAVAELSQRVGRQIAPNSARHPEPFKLILLGDAGAKFEFITAAKMRISKSPYTDAELDSYRSLINKNIIDQIRKLVDSLRASSIKFEKEINREYCEVLSNYILDSKAKTLEPYIGNAIRSLWEDGQVVKFLHHSDEMDSRDYAPYFFDEITRIAQPAYTPTNNDMLKAHVFGLWTGQMEITASDTIRNFNRDTLFISTANTNLTSRRYMRTLSDPFGLVFFVDLASYDRESRYNEGMPELQDTLASFDYIVNSTWFAKSVIFLVFNNLKAFKSKQLQSPLQNSFVDYSPRSEDRWDALGPMTYIKDKFTGKVKDGRQTSVHFTDSIDPKTPGTLMRDVIWEMLMDQSRMNGVSV